MYPSISRANVGMLTPDDLMLGVSIFNALFPEAD